MLVKMRKIIVIKNTVHDKLDCKIKKERMLSQNMIHYRLKSNGDYTDDQ